MLTAGTLAVVLALFALSPPLLEVIELNWLDLRFRTRGPLAPGSAVVVAAIDEKSLDAEGRWPWPRVRLAALVDALSRDGAKVIGFDVLFSEAEQGEGDRELARALERSRAAVVLGYFFHMDERSLGFRLPAGDIERRLRRIADSTYPLVYRDARAPSELFLTAYAPQSNLPELAAAAASSGYFSVTSDPDGVVRWMPLMLEAGDELYPPLAMLCVWHYLDRPPLAVRSGPYGVEGVELGALRIPTDEWGRLLINYRGPAQTFPTYSIADILAGRLPAGTFRDKIVIVGATAIGIGDIRSTPFGPVYPGPKVHATVIDNVLAGDFIARPAASVLLDVVAIVGLGVLVGMSLPSLSALAGFLVASALFLLYVIAAYGLFVGGHVWLNMVYPLFALGATYTVLTVYRFVVEERERKRIKETFQRYLAPDVIELVLRDPGGVRLGGHEALLTALFSDLEGFTSFCENRSPSEITEVLSDYYGGMTEQVFAHQGTLVEYVGDELFALFGAPVAQADHARRACSTALAMRERLEVLGAQWAQIGRPRLRCRIGVNSGTMLVGNIGSKYRFHYSAMGDAVNLASRLEGLNKIYGSEIMVSSHTAEQVPGMFLMRELDLVRVKGRQQALRIYELLGAADMALPPQRRQLLDAYAAGLSAYRERRWNEAREIFEQCLALHPQDGPSRLMLSRCAAFRADPPPENWGGMFEHLTK